jgi:hypothetical protein
MRQASPEWARAEAALRFEIERLSAPVSAEETSLLSAIEQLCFSDIPRASARTLIEMQARPAHCHANAKSFEETDPTGRSRRVAGWWRRGEVFYFHSVVLSQDRLICVTPHPDAAPLRFAPDSDISWIIEAGYQKATRWGRKVPGAVRRDPAKVIAGCQAALRRLNAGDDPRNIRSIL